MHIEINKMSDTKQDAPTCKYVIAECAINWNDPRCLAYASRVSREFDSITEAFHARFENRKYWIPGHEVKVSGSGYRILAIRNGKLDHWNEEEKKAVYREMYSAENRVNTLEKEIEPCLLDMTGESY